MLSTSAPQIGALLSVLSLGETVLEWRHSATLVMVCAGRLVTTERA